MNIDPPLQLEPGKTPIRAQIGEPVVFLSGLFETPAIWRPVRHRLADRQVHEAALPGHDPGDTVENVSRDLSTGEWQGALCDRLEQIANGQRVHVVGHSSGGLVAMQLAARRPNVIRSLTLVGTLMDGQRDVPFDLAAAALKSDFLGKQLFPWLWHSSLTSRANFERVMSTVLQPRVAAEVPDEMRHTLQKCDPEAVRLFAKWLLRQDASGPASNIAVPTHLVIGQQDRVVPAVHQITLLRKIPTAHARVVPGGHLPFLEKPDAFARALRLWFAHTETVPASHPISHRPSGQAQAPCAHFPQ